jgi:hypothetical protein
MRVHRAFTALAAAAVVASVASSPAGAQSVRTTSPLVQTFDGAPPNGPSRNPAVSGDQRVARAMGYESDASNIVPGDTNGVSDVFVVHRAPAADRDGAPWKPLRTQLASRGLGGAPANGRSFDPELDGDSHHAPRCVAFISEASNLVRGDTNGVADTFVYYFGRGKMIRVSVSSRGQQANGPSTDVSVDGNCERVAFSSTATNLAGRTPAGVSQVYVHVASATGLDRRFRGRTLLASASSAGRAGTRSSFDVDFGASGKALVFTSLARLDRGDLNAYADVYEHTLERRFKHLAGGRGVQTLRRRTRVVSRGGNGASTDSAVSDDGSFVAYETLASNLLPGDTNGVSDIARADLSGRVPRQAWVSKSQAIGEPGNGGSNDPDISGAADFVLFDSAATNLLPSASHRDPNGVRDLFLWNRPTRNASLESRTLDNSFLTTPSTNPATSSHGNYVLFENDGMIQLRYEGPE